MIERASLSTILFNFVTYFALSALQNVQFCYEKMKIAFCFIERGKNNIVSIIKNDREKREAKRDSSCML